MMLFAAPDRLKRLQIEITTGCNLRCAGCQRTLGMADGQWVNRHMAPDLFARIISNMPPAPYLVLQGIGEPTLHPRLEDLITLAHQAKRYEVIGFNTNGLVHGIDDYRRWQALGLSHVSLSVDSLDPVLAQQVRAGTDVDQLRRMIRDLVQLFNRRITLSVVLSRVNLPGFAGLLEELGHLGVSTVEVQPLVAYGPTLTSAALRPEDYPAIRAIAAESGRRNPRMTVVLAPILTPNGTRCRRPFHAAYVTVDGFLTPCCLTEDVGVYGRCGVVDQPFAKAWTSDGVQAWLAASYDETPEICRGCCYNPSGSDAATPRDTARLLRGGSTDLQAGRLEQGEQALRRLLTGNGAAEALHQLGLAALRKRQPAEAVPWLDAAARLTPAPPILHALAAAFAQTGQKDRARSIWSALITRHPDYEPSYLALAQLLRDSGQPRDAGAVLLQQARRAVDLNRPDLLDRLLPGLEQGCDDINGLLLLANILRGQSWTELARRLMEQILRRWPDHVGARLTACMSMLPQGYDSASHMTAVRQAYRQALSALARDTTHSDANSLAAAMPQVGQAKPFFLSYQGENDREEQAWYGQIIGRIAAAHDRLTPPPSFPLADAPQPGEKIRIGFVSSYFRLHSVSKLFGGWIKQVDRSRFSVFGYDLSERPQDATADFAHDDWSRDHYDACDSVVGGLRSDETWISAIARDRPHVLIYLELGMDPVAVRLACRRLAPIQAMTWGHPVTSGLSTMDYFLSSDLMEPADGQSHYTETLIRLPNLSVYYQPLPQAAADGEERMTRAGLGLRDDALVFICCQSLFKYRPQEDILFTQIAARLPQSQFVFIGQPGQRRSDLFRTRLQAAFASANLPFDRHVVMVPPVPGPLFQAFLKQGDIYLDSIGWSGGNTSLEAATAGLPLITLAGPLMRARHTAAILRQMGLGEWIAGDVAGLADLAVRLADPTVRTALSAQISERLPWLFGDERPVRALESFLIEATGRILPLS